MRTDPQSPSTRPRVDGSALPSVLPWLLQWVPRGGSLPEQAWRSRHPYVVGLLALHVVGIPVYAYIRGEHPIHSVHGLVPAVILMGMACSRSLGRTVRASCAALGLMLCSGLIVHLSDGLVEAHFHFFVIIPVVALYEAWLPFALGVVYVLVHHGYMGATDPRTVYNHPAAWDHPWLFAAVHAAFFACACLACIVNWSLHERAREASATQSQLLSTIVDSLRDGLVVTDADGRVLVSNPASRALLGSVAWQAPGELPPACDELGLRDVDGRPLAYADLPHQRALRGQAVADLVLRTSGPDAERVLSFSASALDAPSASQRPVVMIARDVTESHRVQEAMAEALATEQQAVERLLEVERVKSDLVSTVSHELRTPITSIIGYVELLEDGLVGDLSDKQQDLVGRVERNSRRLLLLVEDLLTHSQIESSQLSITTEVTDLRDVVTSAKESVTALLGERSLSVRVDLPEAPVLHEVDPGELERMTVNLLTNAIKFTPDGGSIEVSLTHCPAGVTLVVADDGLGIPEDEQHRLFTRFFRSSIAAERAIQGSGLGLSIVRAIVELHGGRVAVCSSPGRGTAVTVELPRQVAAVPTASVTPVVGLAPAV